MTEEPIIFGDHRDAIQTEARRLVDEKIIGAKITLNVGNITLNLEDYPSGFREIPIQDRTRAIAVRLAFKKHRFIITRKLKNGTIIPGFFYHIKQGRKVIMGTTSGVQYPLEAERIGFCYSKNGDSAFVDMNYMNGNAEMGIENIVNRRVNTSLFGDLEQLEVSFVPPRILQNNEDMRIVHVKTN